MDSKICYQVMKEVVCFEKKRVAGWLISTVVLFSTVTSLGVMSWWVVDQVMRELGSAELVEILQEDRQVIHEYKNQIWQTLIIELPTRQVLTGVASTASLFVLIGLTIVKSPSVFRRMRYLTGQSNNSKN